MPVTFDGRKLVLLKSKEEAISIGFTHLANYLENVEEQWKSHATEESKETSVYEYLNYRNKVTIENPNASFKVLFGATATFLASCVVRFKNKLTFCVEGKQINLKAFIVDTKTWYYDTENELEAYYLCGILNSKLVDDWIKPIQTLGQWGERDIHRRPLLLPVPEFKEKDPDHLMIAASAKECEDIVFTNLDKFNSKSIGINRSKVRKMLAENMEKINILVTKVIHISDVKEGLTQLRSKDCRLICLIDFKLNCMAFQGY
jgi:hypothetical protein